MTCDLKKLVVSAMTWLNKQLCLPRTKQVLYSEEEYFALLLFLALEGCAAEDGGAVLNELMSVPSGEALLKQLQKFDRDAVEEEFDRLFVQQFRKVAKKRRPQVTAIIDVHEQETYTKEKRASPDVRGGKHKNGTNFFFQFATIQVLWKEHVVTMGVRLYGRNRTLRSIVNELVRHVQQYCTIKLLLLDRGFRDVELLNQLEYLNVSVLMPAFSDERTRKALATMKLHRRRWSFRNAKSEHTDVTLLKATLLDGKTIGFYTTMKNTWWHPPQHFLDAYKKRWTIETGYRIQNQLLPKTTCVIGAVRLYYFSYAVALHNLWLCLRNTVKNVKFTVLRLKTLLSSTLPNIGGKAPT
jgi:hypothetical protein